MPFPDTQRVLYRKNPLDQVVCQLRFPPILKIDVELPIDFQERVSEIFPNFDETSEIAIELPSEVAKQVPVEVVEQAFKSLALKNYQFTSEDELWKVNLTRMFLSLSTKRYERWEAFKEKLCIPFNALQDVYSPRSFSRIGLRYIDVIKRSNLGLNDVPWRDLLKPHIAGILTSPEVENHVKSIDNAYIVNLGNDNDNVRIIMKLVTAKDGSEVCFMIDSDFFHMGKTSIVEAFNKLDFFNSRASRLIRWAISNRLHEAMEPENI